MNNLTVKELQQKVDEYVKKTKTGYFAELSNLAQLTEEIGELARIINRLHGQQKAKHNEDISQEALADELADILFVTTCLANQLNIDLESAIAKNFQKKELRDKNRHN
jgi:NTP pyrophosphatase (non-canonical NTP hydrolase)